MALIGSAAKSAIPGLILALKDKDERVRQNAGTALVRVGPEAVPALVEALKDNDPVTRAAAAKILGQIGPPTASSAVRALTKAMGDENEHVRKAASQAYKKFPTQGQVDP